MLRIDDIYIWLIGLSICGHNNLNQDNNLAHKRILFQLWFYLNTFSSLLDLYSIDSWIWNIIYNWWNMAAGFI